MSKVGQSVIDHIALADEGTTMAVVANSYIRANQLFDEIFNYVKGARILAKAQLMIHARIITTGDVTITFVVAHEDLLRGYAVDYLFVDGPDEYNANVKDAITMAAFGGVIIEG